MILGLINRLRLRALQRQWRRRNRHNRTEAGSIFDPAKVSVGNFTYGRLNVASSHYADERLEIGHFCSIAGAVWFFLAGNHFVERPTTFPMHGMVSGQGGRDGYSKGAIIVASDVWIGFGAIVLSGVKIGQGAVVGAGSVVSRDVPPYAIVAGNRAEVVKYRFPDSTIAELMNLDFSRWTKDLCLRHVDLLTRPCDTAAIRTLVSAQGKALSETRGLP
jgi:acetyltransferase-like isoleucine patch superfamily enzyme